MLRTERASLARAKRAARLAQLSMTLLGGAEAADLWLSSPCTALGGRAPADVKLDIEGMRRVTRALRACTARADDDGDGTKH